MCRDITAEQRAEGWRAFRELLAEIRAKAAGALAAAGACFAAMRLGQKP